MTQNQPENEKERLSRLEDRVLALERSLAELLARADGLAPGRTVPSVPTPSLESPAEPQRPVAAHLSEDPGALPAILALIGRTLLVLGGAFLLRALTDAHVLPSMLGVALALALGVTQIALADRAATAGRIFSATFHGLGATLIVYPLLWETTTKLHLLAAGTAGVILVVVTGLALLMVWRRGLRGLAWVFTLAALVTILALYNGTRSRELYTMILLLLGTATTWLAYGRTWHIVRWFVAIPADAVVMRLTFLVAHPGGPRPPNEGLSVSAVQGLALSLVVIYVGSFFYRTLARRREVTAFEIVQSLLVLLIGFGGAARIADATGRERAALVLAALLAAGVCYAIAFAFIRRWRGGSRNFFYFGCLAVVFLLLGGQMVSGQVALAFCWWTLAAATAALGGRYGLVTLQWHCAAYLATAAAQTGLLVASLAAFAGASGSAWRVPSGLGLVTLGVALVCYVVLAATQRSGSATLQRLPRFVIAAPTVLGAGALLVVSLVRLLHPDAGSLPPGHVAVMRTGVIAAVAVAVAAASRGRALFELGWLVYPALVLGGIKLLVEDLRCGDAVTHTLGFAFFGTALIAAPRLLRPVKRRGRQDAVP